MMMVTSGPTEDQWVMMVTSAQAYRGPMGDDHTHTTMDTGQSYKLPALVFLGLVFNKKKKKPSWNGVSRVGIA